MAEPFYSDKGRPSIDPVFSQNRLRRFADDQIFRGIFNRIVIECIEKKLVSGKKVVSDGSFIPANAAWDSRVETTAYVEKSMVSYLDDLDAELKMT